MSKSFPSEAYRELCIENQKVLRWEPRVGDWFISSTSGVSGIAWWEDPQRSIKEERAEPSNEEVYWLPRLDQLIEMLEERGYEHALMWDLWGPRSFEPGKRYMLEVTSRLGKMKIFGPDPATALLKAYLEVTKSE